eukprot:TRINITY_DN4258_c1_g1_i4.p1 TRINITY_DN4258_c1_g1~~TRINITY_DN4258_c1_g1_i4.p1  ORF type:complete len:946 (+),score=127.79 TRINITY_DN4258_c1_g1_i4:64-2901(+)
MVIRLLLNLSVVAREWVERIPKGNVDLSARGREYSRLAMLSTNDVYKLVGRSNDRMAWAWDGSLDTPIGEAFLETCRESPGSCFPGSAAQYLGMREERIDKVKLRLTGDGDPQRILVDGDLGCSRSLEDLQKDDVKFGNMLDVGFSAQLRKRQRLSEDPKTLFLNILAGDFLSPSYTAVQTKGMHMLALMNEMEVDAVAFGNHDFDFGNQCDGKLCVTERMKESNFLWLGANTYPKIDSNDTAREALGTRLEVPPVIKYNVGEETRTLTRNPTVFRASDPQPKTYNRLYWTEMVNDRKVCIFGTTQANDATSSAHGTVEFTDANGAGLRALKALQSEPGGCNVVVGLTHQRTGYDILFWKAAIDAGLPPPDVIWGGHDHYAAFLHLEHPDDPSRMTYIWKMGADAHFFGEMLISGDLNVAPQLRLLPVVEGACGNVKEFCSRLPKWEGCAEWAARYSNTYDHFASAVLDLKRERLPVRIRGLYDTANVRVKETRGANLMADLSRIGAGADVAYLKGGEIRQDAFDPKSSKGELLTALDLYEEFPFNDELCAIELSLLQIYGMCVEAVEDRLKGGISASRAHFSGLSVLYDQLGPVTVTFEGPWHVAGLVDRRINSSKGVYPSGTLLWSREDGFGEHDPLSKLSVSGTDYSFFVAPDGILRLSGDLAEVEAQCAYGHDAKTVYFDDLIVCNDGKPPRSYYERLASSASGWRDCGVEPGVLSDTSCWELLAILFEQRAQEDWAKIRRRIVRWKTKKDGGDLTERMEKIFSHEGNGRFGDSLAEALIAAAKSIDWKVGGETEENLEARGVLLDEILVVPQENLPVQRFSDARTKTRQTRLRKLAEGAKKFSGASEQDTQASVTEYKKLLTGAVKAEEEVSQHVGHEIDEQLDILADLEKSDDARAAESLIQLQSRASSLCRLAVWAALEHEPFLDGRALHRAVVERCK